MPPVMPPSKTGNLWTSSDNLATFASNLPSPTSRDFYLGIY